MFLGLRLKLIRLICGSNNSLRIQAGAELLTQGMDSTRSSCIRWKNLAGIPYELVKNPEPRYRVNGDKNSQDHEDCDARCVICTYEFEIGRDGYAKCPSCGSKEVEWVESV